MRKDKKPAAIWCEHCNAEISPAGIKSCLRKTCETKAVLNAYMANLNKAA